jgi:hypothetical protein
MRILFILYYLWVPVYKCITQILSDYISNKRLPYYPFSLRIEMNDTIRETYDYYYEYTNNFLNSIPEHIPIVKRLEYGHFHILVHRLYKKFLSEHSKDSDDV